MNIHRDTGGVIGSGAGMAAWVHPHQGGFDEVICTNMSHRSSSPAGATPWFSTFHRQLLTWDSIPLSHGVRGRRRHLRDFYGTSRLCHDATAASDAPLTRRSYVNTKRRSIERETSLVTRMAPPTRMKTTEASDCPPHEPTLWAKPGIQAPKRSVLTRL